MIYDCFTYNDERFLLTLRCEELRNLDVTHVLIESTHTFTGVEKPLNFQRMKDQFRGYRIESFVVDDMPNNGDPWANERHQRNHIAKALRELNAGNDDVIIISDADEIPSAEAILRYSQDLGIATLQMGLYYYYLNCRKRNAVWHHPKIATWSHMMLFSPDEARMLHYSHTPPAVIENGGWHFSYLANPMKIKEKINSFSHQEFNDEQRNSLDNIRRKMEDGEELFSTEKLEFFWDYIDMPEHVIVNIEVMRSGGLLKSPDKNLLFSVVIPTMWKSDNTPELLHRLILCDYVDEIIIIDNANQFHERFAVVPNKVTVITPSHNMYVNPSWNLGVRVARNDNLAICNDDIIFSTAVFAKFAKNLKHLGVMGQSEGNYINEPTDADMYVEKMTWHNYGWGCLMLVHRRHWVPIPESLRITHGDDWLINVSNNAFTIHNLHIWPKELSATSGRSEFDEIRKMDAMEYKRLMGE